jgi:FMN phosphatase YigB (HAD superfamily)
VTYELFADLWGDIFTPAPDGILRTLDRLRPDVISAIASNTEELHWPYIERLETVQRFISEPNRHIVKSYEIGYQKPDEHFFHAALHAVGVTDPGQVLFIDDVQKNVDAFRAMGGQGEIFDLTIDDPDFLGYILENYGLLI